MAADLVTHIEKRVEAMDDVTIDWTLRTKIKIIVKRILRKHGYPPELRDEAGKTVSAQKELLCADWV